MNLSEDQLYKDFEKEVWLYLDNQLDEKRKLFWDNKIEKYPLLKEYIDEYTAISNEYKSKNLIDIDDERFNLMIENAVEKRSVIAKIKDFILNNFNTETKISFGKIAFASFLIIASIIISIISNKPNPINKFNKTINSELLEWNPKYFEKQINKVETMLKLTKDDDYKKYSKYGLTSENVDKNLNYIGNNIDELKKEINSKEL